MTKAELEKVEQARADARERFKHFRDDDGEASGVVDSDNLPLTDERLARMRPAHEVNPGLVATKLRKVDRPKIDDPKKAISIRLDRDVIETLRAGGAGWQTRANDILRKALKLKAAR